MISLSQLPALNATLNATSGVFLALGSSSSARSVYPHIAQCMMVAVVVSVMFLIS